MATGYGNIQNTCLGAPGALALAAVAPCGAAGLAMRLAVAVRAAATTRLSGSGTGSGRGNGGGHSVSTWNAEILCLLDGRIGYRLDRQVGHLSSPEARQEARAVVSNRWKQGVMVVWAGSVRGSMVIGQAVPRAMASRITAA